MIDERIRASLRGLRSAPIPECPRLAGPVPERRESVLPNLLVASMAVAAMVVLFLPQPSPVSEPRPATEDRWASVQRKIEGVEDERLRDLLRRESELLRLELKLADSELPE